ncbi:hypothetical protein ACFWWC_40020 [Streptomyces sp. NPDC058642]|uniref:hypothetical protein n=1 Tax=Streptomyces sp. NPDC058642 TaxID=3346572 RepID=UPI00364E57BB
MRTVTPLCRLIKTSPVPEAPAVEVDGDLLEGRFGDRSSVAPQCSGGAERSDVDPAPDHRVADEARVLHEDVSGQQAAGDLRAEADPAAGSDHGVVADQRAASAP